MSRLFEEALEKVRAWPEARQDDLARIVFEIERQGVDPIVLDDDERAAIDEAMAEIEADQFASEAQVDSAFKRFRG